jgi:hypothetical protein
LAKEAVNHTKSIAANCNVLYSIPYPRFEFLSGNPCSYEAEREGAGEDLHYRRGMMQRKAVYEDNNVPEKEFFLSQQ